jgi:hypothetical protein
MQLHSGQTDRAALLLYQINLVLRPSMSEWHEHTDENLQGSHTGSVWIEQNQSCCPPVFPDAEQEYSELLTHSYSAMETLDVPMAQPLDWGYEEEEEAQRSSTGLPYPYANHVDGNGNAKSFGPTSTVGDQDQLLNQYWQTGYQSPQTLFWGPTYSEPRSWITVNLSDLTSIPSVHLESSNPVAQHTGYLPIDSGCQSEITGGANSREKFAIRRMNMAVDGKISKPVRPPGTPCSKPTRQLLKKHYKTDAHRAAISANSPRAKRYKVWRQDNAAFCNESGETVDTMEVPTQKKLAKHIRCDPETIRRAFVGRGEKTAIIKNDWLVQELDKTKT